MRSIYLFLIIFGFIGFQKTFISYLTVRISLKNRITVYPHLTVYFSLPITHITLSLHGEWPDLEMGLKLIGVKHLWAFNSSKLSNPKLYIFITEKEKKKQKEKENENYQKFQSLNPTDPVRILRSVVSVFITIPISLV